MDPGRSEIRQCFAKIRRIVIQRGIIYKIRNLSFRILEEEPEGDILVGGNRQKESGNPHPQKWAAALFSERP
jgi:hypothetical protein